MRVAIAGTHRVGKTTLVEAFAVAHPEFEVVPEPYEQLLEEGAESFLDELSPESFLAQLARAADRLATAGRATIFDRSPLDFLAYLRAVDELRLGSGGWDLPRESLAPAAASLARLDIIGYIPLPPSRRTRSRPGLRSRRSPPCPPAALGRARPARRARLSPGRPAGRAGAVAPGSAGKHHARGGSPVPLALCGSDAPAAGAEGEVFPPGRRAAAVSSSRRPARGRTSSATPDKIPMTGIVVLAVLALLAVFVIGVYNGLVKLRVLANNAWADIDVQLKRRYDLVPNLVETVKGYAGHERETLENVTRARQQAVQLSGGSPAERAAAENMLTQTLRSLFAVSEAYPQLRANENFRDLQSTLTSLEDAIQNARRYYNAVVRDYNTKVDVFPSNLVANTFRFEHRDFFELAEPERAAPKVQF